MIRPAHQGDLGVVSRGVVALGEHVKAHGEGPFIADLPDDLLEVAEDAVRQHVDGDDRFVLVADRDDEVIGWILGLVGAASVGWSTRLVGRINGCWVDPPERGHGVARALVAAAEDEFRRHGIDTVEVAYVCGNAEAQGAWQALGYRPHRVFAGKRL